jgi:imidazole glycerol-phosphate synthase subunit HisH
MIGIVDYEAGNIASVSNALNAVGARFVVSGDPSVLNTCGGIILPGVGAAPGAMAALKQRGLGKFLSQCRRPLLGICLGMQLLYESSEEGETMCIGVFPGPVKKFDETRQKVPHMGWNEVYCTRVNPLMGGVGTKEYFYFANSYFIEPDSLTVATSSQDRAFAAVVASGNYYGVQFHPEKSGAAGLAVLRNFDALCK